MTPQVPGVCDLIPMHDDLSNYSRLFDTARIDRRAFLRRAKLAATGIGALGLSGCFRDALSPNGISEKSPLHSIYDVAAFGAKGDGLNDDTGAIQEAVTAAARAGHTVLIPAGIYLIDAARSVDLQSGVRLLLAPGATLRAIPNNLKSSAMLRATDQQDITVEGGTLEGERYQHLGTVGEWGMAINLRGCKNVKIRNVTARYCWGDGIYVGESSRPCEDILIENCVMDRNRRQGISVVACIGGVITGCILSNTSGTEPQSGIDLEPNGNGRVSGMRVINCLVFGNAGCGIQLFGKGVTSNVISDNECRENQRSGIWMAGGARNEVTNNRSRLNGRHGILLDRFAFHNTVAKNQCEGNSQSRDLSFDNIHLDSGASVNVLMRNVCIETYADAPLRSRHGIRINDESCEQNRLMGNQLFAVVTPLSDGGTGTLIVK